MEENFLVRHSSEVNRFIEQIAKMDVPNSGTNISEEKNSSDHGKKSKRKRKNRSAKQIERARKYRERNSYHIDARNIIMTDPTHATICHTKGEFGQHLYTQPTNPPLQFAGLNLSGATESHPPAYFLCPGMVPNVPWNMPNIGTIIHEPVSNAEVFVSTSTNMSNIASIVQDQVSNLRATARVFVPASATKVESTFESNEDSNKEKVDNPSLKSISIPEQHLTVVNIDNVIPESNDTSIATKDEDSMRSDSKKEERRLTGSSDMHNDDNKLEESVLYENSTPEDDASDMFSILQVFASSSLHCALNMTTKSGSTCTDENDFGYAYFDMSNL